MNQRGIFITFMVFLLVASILALHDTSKKTDYKQERRYIDEAAFNSVNNAFNNLYEEMVSLSKEGRAKIIQERSLPFLYNFNKNSIILSRQIPVNTGVFDAYIDTLNIYSIFVDANMAADLNIVTKTIQNTAWGGSAEFPDLNYAILPQCLLYDINADSIMVLRELDAGQFGCLSDFNYLDLNIMDINISINSSQCAEGSYIGTLAELPLEEFNPLETKPFFRVTINETNPINYPITGTGKLEFYGHFNPESYETEDSKDWLTIDCDTGGGAELWLRIKLGMENENDPFPFVAQNFIPAQPVGIDLNVTFDKKVDLFYFTGFSISVNKVNFPIKRRT